MKITKILISLSLLGAIACSGQSSSNTTKSVTLANQSDSLSYIIGLSLAESVAKIDSMVNVDMLCKALQDHAAGKPLITMEDARTAYLRYLLHVEPTRRRNLEAQYIKELEAANRDISLDRMGVAYRIEDVGNEKNTPKNNNDWVVIHYTISRIDGEQLYSTHEHGDSLASALGDLPAGMQSSIKHIGEGGKIEAWIPSTLAYGESGDETIGVAPFETLRYNIELLKNELAAAKRYAPTRAEDL